MIIRHLFAAIPVVLAIAFVSFSAHANFIKGPYIQNLTRTSVTIMFHSDREGVEIEWGETPSFGTKHHFNEHDDWIDGFFKVHDTDHETLFGSSDADLYEITLSGLVPGTTYYYRAINLEEGFGQPQETTQTLKFTTPPEQPSYPFVFGVIGDCKAKGDLFSSANITNQKITNLLIANKPEIVIETGDMTGDSDTYGDWQKLFDIRKKLFQDSAFYPTMGNHDNDDDGRNFQRYFSLPRTPLTGAGDYPANDAGNHDDTELFYSFDFQGVHFIAVNTEFTMDPGSDQHTFIDEDLSKHPCTPKIAFYHIPTFTYGEKDDSQYLIDNLHPLFVKHGLDIVFQGHDHNYQRMETDATDGTLYIVTGGGGASLDVLDLTGENLANGIEDNHYILMHYDGHTLTGKVYLNNGELFETFEIDPLANDPESCKPVEPEHVPEPEPIPEPSPEPVPEPASEPLPDKAADEAPIPGDDSVSEDPNDAPPGDDDGPTTGDEAGGKPSDVEGHQPPVEIGGLDQSGQAGSSSCSASITDRHDTAFMLFLAALFVIVLARRRLS